MAVGLLYEKKRLLSLSKKGTEKREEGKRKKETRRKEEGGL